jgi:transcriptional regulator with XRE-family HTH domain
MDKAIVMTIRKDMGKHLLKVMKDNRISRRRIAKLSGINRETISYIINGKNKYYVDTYIAVMGTVNELVGLKNYSALNFPYRAINKYCSTKKCESIEFIVATYLGISVEYMKAHARNTIQVKARMYCYDFELRYTRISKSDIADRFGLDHATILNALKRLDNLLDTGDPLIEDYYDLLDTFDEKWKKTDNKITKSNV